MEPTRAATMSGLRSSSSRRSRVEIKAPAWDPLLESESEASGVCWS